MKWKNMIAGTFVIALCSVVQGINAASVTVGFSPNARQVASGTLGITVDVIGTYSPDLAEGLLGGALDLAFDARILSVASVVLMVPTDIFGDTGTIDNTAGTVDRIGFGTFDTPVTGAFTFARVTFDAIGVGTSSLTLADSNDNILPWANEVPVAVPVIANVGSITVVPLPAALWLFVAGIAGLTGVSIRKVQGKS